MGCSGGRPDRSQQACLMFTECMPTTFLVPCRFAPLSSLLFGATETRISNAKTLAVVPHQVRSSSTAWHPARPSEPQLSGQGPRAAPLQHRLAAAVRAPRMRSQHAASLSQGWRSAALLSASHGSVVCNTSKRSALRSRPVSSPQTQAPPLAARVAMGHAYRTPLERSRVLCPLGGRSSQARPMLSPGRAPAARTPRPPHPAVGTQTPPALTSITAARLSPAATTSIESPQRPATPPKQLQPPVLLYTQARGSHCPEIPPPISLSAA